MPTRKIRDLSPQETCTYSEHNPPLGIYEPGVYEHTCPQCGLELEFTIFPDRTSEPIYTNGTVTSAMYNYVTPDNSIKSAATSLGRKGGQTGGSARARSLSPQQRSDIARKAANARWGNADDAVAKLSGKEKEK